MRRIICHELRWLRHLHLIPFHLLALAYPLSLSLLVTFYLFLFSFLSHFFPSPLPFASRFIFLQILSLFLLPNSSPNFSFFQTVSFSFPSFYPLSLCFSNLFISKMFFFNSFLDHFFVGILIPVLPLSGLS